MERTVSSNSVLVDGDVSKVADLLNLGSSKTKRSEVPEDEVVVRSTGLELVVGSVLKEGGREGSGVVDDGAGVGPPGGRGNLLERDGDGGDGLIGAKEKKGGHS